MRNVKSKRRAKCPQGRAKAPKSVFRRVFDGSGGNFLPAGGKLSPLCTEILPLLPFFGRKEKFFPMNIASLLDPAAAAIVVGGTLVATVMRCGFTDCGHALAALSRIGRTRFDAQGVRAELAVQVRQIHKDGLFRVNPHQFGDNEFDEATEALIAKRSVPALLAAHESHKQRRLESDDRAVRTLVQAAELGPVFGLVGTLYSLSQLAADGIGKDAFAGAISTAVLTTLYGLLLANLLIAPLARLVERASTREEKERQKVVDWLAQQVASDIPRSKPVVVAEAV